MNLFVEIKTNIYSRNCENFLNYKEKLHPGNSSASKIFESPLFSLMTESTIKTQFLPHPIAFFDILTKRIKRNRPALFDTIHSSIQFRDPEGIFKSHRTSRYRKGMCQHQTHHHRTIIINHYTRHFSSGSGNIRFVMRQKS